MQKRKILHMRITDKCNFNCSFCSQKNRLKNPVQENENLILENLEKNKYDLYTFVGGEPFLKFDFLKKIISIIPKEPLKIIHTNAILLNEEIVSWINENKISLSVSLNGVESGEKSFNDISKISSAGKNLKDLINKVTSLSIRKVILKEESKEDILLSIFALHQTFPNAKITVMFDWWRIEEMNIRDFFNLEFVLICLKKFDTSFTNWFELPLAPCDLVCERCNPFGINPDGSTFSCDFEEAGFKKLSKEQEALFKKLKVRYFSKKEEDLPIN